MKVNAYEMIIGFMIAHMQRLIELVKKDRIETVIAEIVEPERQRQKEDPWKWVAVEVEGVEVNEQRTTNAPEFWGALAVREVKRG